MLFVVLKLQCAQESLGSVLKMQISQSGLGFSVLVILGALEKHSSDQAHRQASPSHAPLGFASWFGVSVLVEVYQNSLGTTSGANACHMATGFICSTPLWGALFFVPHS